MMKLSKWLTSIAVAVTLLGSGATVLSANTNVQAAKKSSKKKFNGYLHKKFPGYVLRDGYFLTGNLDSDRSDASYMRRGVVPVSGYKTAIISYYYDDNGNLIENDIDTKYYSTPYLTLNRVQFFLTSAPSKNAPTVISTPIYKPKNESKSDQVIFFYKLNGQDVNTGYTYQEYNSADAYNAAIEAK